ncbi:MAG: retroviral-like aspartic protease family protein [Planctomycetota bacterium]
MIRRPLDPVYKPPAPVLDLLVGGSGPGPLIRCRFVIDTGADRTLIPAHVASPLGFEDATAARIVMYGFDGQPRDLPGGWFRIVGPGSVDELECVVRSASVGLLGRDFLQHRRLTVDGPGGTFTVEG